MRLLDSTSFFLAAALLAGCADSPTEPVAVPQFDAGGNGNGVLIEIGEWSVPGSRIVWDWDNHLLLYYRWSNAFPCTQTAATQFTVATWRDVIRMDEAWRTVEKSEGVWLYVYDFHGETVDCAFLTSQRLLATGRGSRQYIDNDFYPWAPYGPGPGANAFKWQWHGDLITTAGDPVQFMGLERGTLAADGNTIRNYEVRLQLSPDPRG